MYEVNGTPFTSYLLAIGTAKTLNVSVFEVRPSGERIVRWSPAPKAAAKARHVIVNPDGTTKEFGKVRR